MRLQPVKKEICNVLRSLLSPITAEYTIGPETHPVLHNYDGHGETHFNFYNHGTTPKYTENVLLFNVFVELLSLFLIPNFRIRSL